MIPVINTDSNDKLHKHCEVCQRAQQTHDKFPLSNDKTANIFKLIHYDLWGPYRTSSSWVAHYVLTIVDNCSHAV